jgi:cbb3-type cytochrome oxidase subunit 3
MLLLILEALAALGLLLFMVWWTMFSGRRRGEQTEEHTSEARPDDPPERGPR